MMDDLRLFLQQLRVICVKEIMAIWNALCSTER